MYSGQETSTRYIDMSKQEIIDPLKTEESKKIMEAWMDFYISSQPVIEEHLKNKYPRKPEEDEVMYGKAIKARTFDILRSFLPAGITTQLSWHTNLRQGWDKLSVMKHNPVPEIREIAEEMLAKLKEKYPNSFSFELQEVQETYREYLGQVYNYYNPESFPEFSGKTNIVSEELNKYKDILFFRPPKTGLPHFLTELGNIRFDFLLDFGSFRDIQRHRNGVCRMPLLTTKRGFNAWYLEQLPNDLRIKAEKLIEEQKARIEKLEASPEIIQYYIALGFNVPCRVSYGLPATVYVTELRSGRTVHPTLRKIAHKMGEWLDDKFPGLKLHLDLDMDDWDVRRGLNDIVEKK